MSYELQTRGLTGGYRWLGGCRMERSNQRWAKTLAEDRECASNERFDPAKSGGLRLNLRQAGPVQLIFPSYFRRRGGVIHETAKAGPGQARSYQDKQ